MQQTRLGSLIQSLMNVVIGHGVALLSQVVIFPMFQIYVSFSTNLWLGAWFTIVSLFRSYIIRRWFNTRLHLVAQSMANNAVKTYSA